MGVAGGLLQVAVDGRVQLGHLVSLALQCSKKGVKGEKYRQDVSHAAGRICGVGGSHGQQRANCLNAGAHIILLAEAHDGFGARRKGGPWGEDTSSGALQEACGAVHSAKGHDWFGKDFDARENFEKETTEPKLECACNG
jgi:hypothetical protein